MDRIGDFFFTPSAHNHFFTMWRKGGGGKGDRFNKMATVRAIYSLYADRAKERLMGFINTNNLVIPPLARTFLCSALYQLNGLLPSDGPWDTLFFKFKKETVIDKFAEFYWPTAIIADSHKTRVDGSIHSTRNTKISDGSKLESRGAVMKGEGKGDKKVRERKLFKKVECIRLGASGAIGMPLYPPKSVPAECRQQIKELFVEILTVNEILKRLTNRLNAGEIDQKHLQSTKNRQHLKVRVPTK